MRLLLFLLLILSYPASAELSDKIFVSVLLPINNKIVKDKINLEQAKLIAKNKIIKQYIINNVSLPKNIKDYHKNFIINLIIKSNELDFELINFKKDKAIKTNDFVRYFFSSNINEKKLNINFDLWEKLNKLIHNNSLSPLLSLELALTYNENIKILPVLKNWKQVFKGGILYIVTNNLIEKPQLFNFIDKRFYKDELNINLNQLTFLFDMAPFNIDVCLRFYDALENKNYKSLSKKVLLACKTVNKSKVSENDYQKMIDESSRLKDFDFDISKFKLLSKIIKFNGNLPLTLNDSKMFSDENNLENLLLRFEKEYLLSDLIKIRDILKSKNLTNLSKLLSDQIGVSQNDNYKY